MVGPMTAPTMQRMTKMEARKAVGRMRGYDRAFWLELLEFLDREGWRSLGYSRASECLAVELQRTVRMGQYLIQAAGTYNATNHGSSADRATAFPERHLRELARLPTDVLRREVFAEAQADGDTTAAAIRQLVDARLEHAADDMEDVADEAREFAAKDCAGQPRPASGTDWSARAVKHLADVLKIVRREDERCRRARPHLERAAAILRGEE